MKQKFKILSTRPEWAYKYCGQVRQGGEALPKGTADGLGAPPVDADVGAEARQIRHSKGKIKKILNQQIVCWQARKGWEGQGRSR